MADEIIGEAVLVLLSGNKPITLQALLHQLNIMNAQEKDSRRKKVIINAITEINSAISKVNVNKDKRGSADYLFDAGISSSARKLH